MFSPIWGILLMGLIGALGLLGMALNFALQVTAATRLRPAGAAQIAGSDAGRRAREGSRNGAWRPGRQLRVLAERYALFLTAACSKETD